MDLDPHVSLFLPVFGETRRNNSPALSQWTLGVRAISLISSNENFIRPNKHVKNALKQPSSFEFAALKNQFKKSLLGIFRDANYKKMKDVCQFNIYWRIIYKSKSVCSYYYRHLNYKKNKTLLWEKSRLSLESDWEKKVPTL